MVTSPIASLYCATALWLWHNFRIMPWRSAVLGHVMGWLSDIYQLMACLSTLTNIQCATLHSTGLPGLKVTLGNYRGSLVSVRFWYRKRGFLGLCFFDTLLSRCASCMQTSPSHNSTGYVESNSILMISFWLVAFVMILSLQKVTF